MLRSLPYHSRAHPGRVRDLKHRRARCGRMRSFRRRSMTAITGTTTFYGWRVVGAAFVLAVFGWGLGFYGPPIYLHAVQEARGWPLALVSTAVTLHFLLRPVFP